MMSHKNSINYASSDSLFADTCLEKLNTDCVQLKLNTKHAACVRSPLNLNVSYTYELYAFETKVSEYTLFAAENKQSVCLNRRILTNHLANVYTGGSVESTGALKDNSGDNFCFLQLKSPEGN